MENMIELDQTNDFLVSFKPEDSYTKAFDTHNDQQKSQMIESCADESAEILERGIDDTETEEIHSFEELNERITRWIGALEIGQKAKAADPCQKSKAADPFNIKKTVNEPSTPADRTHHFRCPECPNGAKSLSNASNYINHMYTIHSDQTESCRECGAEGFIGKTGLILHLRDQHPAAYEPFRFKQGPNSNTPSEFCCDQCGVLFAYRISLNKHFGQAECCKSPIVKQPVQRKTPEEVYAEIRCPDCGSRYKHPSHLANHRYRAHQILTPGYENKVCAGCQKIVFKRDRHRCSGVPSIKQYCPTYRVYGTRKYLCRLCSFGARKFIQLKAHCDAEHGGRGLTVIRCDNCHRAFANWVFMNNHIKKRRCLSPIKQTIEDPDTKETIPAKRIRRKPFWECPICALRLRLHEVDGHVAGVHPDVKEELKELDGNESMLAAAPSSAPEGSQETIDKENVVDAGGPNKRKCFYCGPKFECDSYMELRNHVNRYHGRGRHRCSKCNFCSEIQTDLRLHVLTHL